LRAVDTSVIVAAFASWHELHAPARRLLRDDPAAVGHCLVETYSVLTRLPAPNRVAPEVALDFLDRQFPDPPLVLTPTRLRDFVHSLAAHHLTGGATYDALIAATANAARATLVTCDERAGRTYTRIGVDFEMLG
jgi:predicted nucleic acid-binding protein